MSSSQPGWRELFSGKNTVYSLVINGAVVLYALNAYITTTILPSIVKDIGGLDYYAWNTTLFIVASILGSAVAAKLFQVAGPRLSYVIAALLFTAGTLMCALAPSMLIMLIGRTIQGLGGGILFSLSIALIRVVFPKALWTRAIGVQSTMWGIATLVGPAVGGIFAEFNIWRAAFWTLMPLAAVFVILAIVVLPVRSKDESGALRLPLAQLLLLTAASLVISTSSVAQTAVWGIAGMLAGFLLVVLLAVTEARATHRLLPRGTLKFRTALGALYATVALLVMASTSEIFVPYFLQVLHGQSPLIAGYLAALAAAGWSAGSILSSSWSGPAGLRTILASPIILLVGILALMVLLPLAGGRADWLLLTVVSIALTLVGLGIGIGWPHLYAHVIQNAPASEQDLAGSAIVTVQLFAQALGAAAAGMVVNFAGLTEPGGVAGARNAAFWLFAVFALAPALAIVTARRGVRDTVDKTPAAGVAAKGS